MRHILGLFNPALYEPSQKVYFLIRIAHTIKNVLSLHYRNDIPILQVIYHKRLIQDKISRLKEHFKAVLITGPRQVGKSTLLKQLFPDYPIVVFDPVQDLYNARKDPDLFLQNFKPPIILDEVQYVPELFPALKRKMDESDQKGQYFLTGSSNLSMLKNLAESMAGRVGIVTLHGLTVYEFDNQFPKSNWLDIYLSNAEDLIGQFEGRSQQTLYTYLWKGQFPAALTLPDEFIPSFFSSYIQTYVERDIRLIDTIKDITLFDRFLGLIAALTGQEINETQLGRELSITNKTSHRWKELLMHTYLWRELPPYYGNTIKRLSKKSKGYMTDTGLCCYLHMLSAPEALARHPLFGALFESFVINHLAVLGDALTVKPKMYHWRTNAGTEVDCVLERDGYLYPIEIKGKTHVTKQDASGILAFKGTYPHSKTGLIIYAGDKSFKINDDVIALPWNAF